MNVLDYIISETSLDITDIYTAISKGLITITVNHSFTKGKVYAISSLLALDMSYIKDIQIDYNNLTSSSTESGNNTSNSGTTISLNSSSVPKPTKDNQVLVSTTTNNKISSAWVDKSELRVLENPDGTVSIPTDNGVVSIDPSLLISKDTPNDLHTGSDSRLVSAPVDTDFLANYLLHRG